jgi:uncharacterized protein (TIGR00296 family)
MPLSEEQQKCISIYCFEVLEVALTRDIRVGSPSTMARPISKNFKETLLKHLDYHSELLKDASIVRMECPLFVTWKKRSTDGSYRLRGCIGTFENRNLIDGVMQYSLESAFRDYRFKGISKAELEHLSCTVSLLVRFDSTAKHLLDWDLDRHGIKIEFLSEIDRHTYSATYLPEVAKEQGWTHEEAITELIRKSGYPGEITAKLKASIQLTRYEALKITCTYEEYLNHRKSQT